MKLSDNIHLAEQRFIPALELFFNSVYADIKLPSHGIDHHRRVWKYAKELLQNIGSEEISTDLFFVEKLLIACYLHDIGMAIDPGERHGLHSRRLCEQFLSVNKLDLSDFQDVLEAIDNHDNKEYSDSQANNRLLLILSVADDLDAFGYIGVYRYFEIYLARGIQPEKIGPMARDNAKKRFKNFKLHFTSNPELVKKHWARYLALDKFFEGFCKETDSK
jgi:Predicted HD superfamily hydrolase